MPQEEKKEQEPQKEQPPEANHAPTAEDLEAIKAQLEEEKKAHAAIETERQGLETKLTSAQGRIAELEKALNDAVHAREAAATDLSKAVGKYLEAVKAANPTLPPDVIGGASIDDIDASVTRARAIAESVKKTLEAQASEAKVPAGAPARGAISVEGLSPREMIALGLQHSRAPTA